MPRQKDDQVTHIRMTRWTAARAALAATCAIATLATASPALAISGSSLSGNAAAAQYTSPGSHPGGTTLGSSPSGTGPSTGVSGATPGTTPQAASLSQSGGLPFTGYAALTAVILGLVLASVGVAMRRTVRAS
jgi:hypothetical protein